MNRWKKWNNDVTLKQPNVGAQVVSLPDDDVRVAPPIEATATSKVGERERETDRASDRQSEREEGERASERREEKAPKL